MVNAVNDFKAALERVPLVLLDPEDARVLTDARTSAGVLDSLLSSPMSIVFVGNTGVGKSHLVNGIAGMDVSPASDLRPTTTNVVMAGSSGPAIIDRANEYVLVPLMPAGLAVVDTPAWESARGVVSAALSNADVGVLVVSPSRYADATTAELWNALQTVPSRIVVLNRQRGTPSEQGEILESVRDQFGDAEVMVLDERGESAGLLEGILEGTPGRRSRTDKAVIARAAAVHAGRYVVRAVTVASVDLGRLAAAVDDVTLPESPGMNLPVRETWLETEVELVAAIASSVDELDRGIIESADNAVAERMLRALGTWQSSKAQDALRVWQIDVGARFRSSATIRWRRKSTEQMIDREAWKLGVNPSVRAPKRVRGAMKSKLDRVATQSHDLLVAIFEDALDQRLEAWRGTVVNASSFKPGELLAAVEVLEDR